VRRRRLHGLRARSRRPVEVSGKTASFLASSGRVSACGARRTQALGAERLGSRETPAREPWTREAPLPTASSLRTRERVTASDEDESETSSPPRLACPLAQARGGLRQDRVLPRFERESEHACVRSETDAGPGRGTPRVTRDASARAADVRGALPTASSLRTRERVTASDEDESETSSPPRLACPLTQACGGLRQDRVLPRFETREHA
jgi:hypothetical protein